MVVSFATFESEGVDTIPTDGIRAIFAAVHPTIAPPPIVPTTTSGFTSRNNFMASEAALIVLNPPFNNVAFGAACPPAWGMLVSCHLIPFFFE
mgnify:CR=1 FL=1